MSEAFYEMNIDLSPPSFLPTALDKSRLVDVTQPYHAFRVYLDMRTGDTHDGAVYFQRAQELQ